VGDDVPVDSKVLLVTDFVNLKIKPTQSFEGAHMGRVCVRVFIGVSARTCMSICVCTVFLKKKLLKKDKLNRRLASGLDHTLMDRISSKAASISISCFESIALFSKTFIASPISSESRFLFSLSAT
jgi:hypothetical protein